MTDEPRREPRMKKLSHEEREQRVEQAIADLLGMLSEMFPGQDGYSDLAEAIASLIDAKLAERDGYP